MTTIEQAEQEILAYYASSRELHALLDDIRFDADCRRDFILLGHELRRSPDTIEAALISLANRQEVAS